MPPARHDGNQSAVIKSTQLAWIISPWSETAASVHYPDLPDGLLLKVNQSPILHTTEFRLAFADIRKKAICPQEAVTFDSDPGWKHRL